MPDKNITDKAYSFFLGKNLLGITGAVWYDEYMEDTKANHIMSFAEYLYCIWIDAGMNPYGIDFDRIASRLINKEK